MKRKQGQEPLKCDQPELGGLFPFYVSGNATPNECRKIEEHIARCTECQEELRFFLTLREEGFRGRNSALKVRAASST
jgi:hypothetical protein